MKKYLLALLSILLLVIAVPVSATSLGAGDYAYFGKYGGTPILWRCVSVDSNGALMVSENIISLKSFDASGIGGDSRKLMGSGRWKASALRKWLNSSSNSVDYSSGSVPKSANLLMKKNGYSDESGFLSQANFSSDELSLINEVSRKTFISKLDSADANGGSQPYCLPNAFGEIGSNATQAYYENTVDRIFLLSSDEMAEISKKFGKSFYFVKPTAGAVAESEYKSENLSVENYWNWWLRDCVATDSGARVACACPINKLSQKGWISGEYAYNDGIGVRPACYLNNANVALSNGDGSESSPYTAGVFTAVNCVSSVKTGKVGEWVSIDISTSYAPKNSATGIILNGNLVKDFNSGNAIKLERGENTVSAVLYTSDGIVAQSPQISVFGENTYVADRMEKFTFDNWDSSDFKVIDGQLVKNDDGSVSSSKGYSIYFPNFSEIDDGILEISYDITCESQKYINILFGGYALSLCAGGEWISPVTFHDGYIYCGDKKAFERFKNGETYSLTVQCDFNRGIASVALNGVYSAATTSLPDIESAPITLAKMSINNPNCTVALSGLSAELKKEKFIASSSITTCEKNGGISAQISISKFCGSGNLTLASVVFSGDRVADVQLRDIKLLNSEEKLTVDVFHPIEVNGDYSLKAFLVYSGDLLNHISYFER